MNERMNEKFMQIFYETENRAMKKSPKSKSFSRLAMREQKIQIRGI